MNEEHNVQDVQTENEKNKFNKKELILFLFLCIILVGGLCSLSFAFYRQFGGSSSPDHSNNSIHSGNITFVYNEGTSAGGSMIHMENAHPMRDEDGKVMIADQSYFDFQILANTSSHKLIYQILLEEMDGNTLEPENVKIYLTEVNGNDEIPVPETDLSSGVLTFDQLKDSTLDKAIGKVLIEREISGDTQKNYRLRMWVKRGVTDYQNKKFSLKVNVVAHSEM